MILFQINMFWISRFVKAVIPNDLIVDYFQNTTILHYSSSCFQTKIKHVCNQKPKTKARSLSKPKVGVSLFRSSQLEAFLAIVDHGIPSFLKPSGDRVRITIIGYTEGRCFEKER